MRVAVTLFLVFLFASPAAAQRPDQSAPQPKRPEHERERLGVRGGFVGTTSTLKDNFGQGINLDLHWITHIKRPVYVDFTLGSFYMGDTDNTQISSDFWGVDYDGVAIRFIRFTAAPMLDFELSEKWNGYFGAGGGIYILSLLLEENFFGFDLTESYWGINLNGGFTRRITENWFIDFHGEVHKFWTPTDANDLFFVYSEGDSDPLFYEITAGLLLRLF